MMSGLGAIIGIMLTVASRVFYVYEDPRIELVVQCFAAANCGACGYAGCSAAAVAVVEGKAPPSVCIVGGADSAQGASEIMGVAVGLVETATSGNFCAGGDRATDRFIYLGANSCRAQALLYGGKRDCEIGCLGHGDCIASCLFDALEMGLDGFPVVDEEKCVGCGACERICPKGILEIKTPSERLLFFNQADHCHAPCQQTCPAEIDIPLYIEQIHRGDYEGAVHTIRERNPFLLACGRVCPHPCESNCRRGIEDDAVSINQLKRLAYPVSSGAAFSLSASG
jgi:Na+-translocating ferredoxin:NAD+ oxidoreductase RNF subunit RnfB